MKTISKLFVALAFIGFAGMFFTAGALSADSLTLMQSCYLGALAVVLMGAGVIGYMVCGEVKVK